MKIVIRRHESDYHVFRLLAVAQALQELTGLADGKKLEVFIECLIAHRGPLALAPSVSWKHPHEPFEKSAVRFVKADQSIGDRPAVKLYDQVLDLDGEGPFEASWIHTALEWWAWIEQKSLEAYPDLKISRFPRLEALPAAGALNKPGSYVILAPMGELSDPSHINLKNIETHVAGKFPGLQILWLAPGNVGSLGPGRPIARYASYPELARTLQGAAAVYAVHGTVAAIAQSSFEGKPLVKRFCFIRGRKPGLIRKASRKNSPPIETAVPDPDPFARIRARINGEPAAGAGGILDVNDKLELLEASPLPGD